MDKVFNVTRLMSIERAIIITALEHELFEAQENKGGSNFDANVIQLTLDKFEKLHAAQQIIAPSVTLYMELV